MQNLRGWILDHGAGSLHTYYEISETEGNIYWNRWDNFLLRVFSNLQAYFMSLFVATSL